MLIFGLAAGIALLYFWLIANWFARILMFLLILAAFIASASAFHIQSQGAGIVFMIASAVMAWFLSGLPKYASAAYRNHRERAAAVEFHIGYPR